MARFLRRHVIRHRAGVDRSRRSQRDLHRSDSDGVVEIPACVGWQNQVNGPERACASNDPALQFRYKTTPDNKAKCNCDPLLFN